MKFIHPLSLSRIFTFIAGLGLVAATQAQFILYDGFDYPPGGSLNGRGENRFSWGTNVWQKDLHATSDWLVYSNSLSNPLFPGSGAYVAETNNTQGASYERKFVPHILGDGDSFWFSFLVKITQGASWKLYFESSGLNESSRGILGNYVDYRIHARLGVGYNGSDETIDLGSNTTRFVVGRYLYSASGDEQLDVWVDPDVSAEPQPGGTTSAYHIVHRRALTSEPDRIDSVLLEDRSIGSLAFDELRVGTSWTEVNSNAVDRVSIERIVVDGSGVTLGLNRLTPGATTTVERASSLLVTQSWSRVDSFVPMGRSTNWVEIPPAGSGNFYRVHTR